MREQLRWSRAGWHVEREIDASSIAARTIVAGPWLSEVGFETLYWVPFLRWVKAAFRLDPSRVVAVSRGGTAIVVPRESRSDTSSTGITSIRLEFARRASERGATKQLEEQYVTNQ